MKIAVCAVITLACFQVFSHKIGDAAFEAVESKPVAVAIKDRNHLIASY